MERGQAGRTDQRLSTPRNGVCLGSFRVCSAPSPVEGKGCFLGLWALTPTPPYLGARFDPGSGFRSPQNLWEEVVGKGLGL